MLGLRGVGLGPPQNDIAMAWWAKVRPTVQIAAKRRKSCSRGKRDGYGLLAREVAAWFSVV